LNSIAPDPSLLLCHVQRAPLPDGAPPYTICIAGSRWFQIDHCFHARGSAINP
jgi:hypothetical protein